MLTVEEEKIVNGVLLDRAIKIVTAYHKLDQSNLNDGLIKLCQDHNTTQEEISRLVTMNKSNNFVEVLKKLGERSE
jgi:hypothetical protein